MESPPTSAQLVISSSPDLPDLEEILSKIPRKPSLRSGSHASAIPATTRTTFTSAVEVLREAPEIDIETEEITKSPTRRAKPVRQRGTKAQLVHERPALDRTGSLGSLSPDEKPWQRYRTKQSPSDGSPSPSRSSTVKQPTVETARKSNAKVGPKIVSRHFAAKSKSPPIDLTSAEPVLPVEPVSPGTGPSAFARRRDWTPPPADTVILLDSESDNKEVLSSAVKEPIDEMRGKAVFATLRDQYGCKVESSSLIRGNQIPTEVLGKRKLIETVASAGADLGTSRSVSPIKPTATKRKVRTITELATAPYAAPIEPEFDITLGHTRESLLGYLDEGGDVKALFDAQEAVLAKAKDGKKPVKAPPKKPRKKNGKVVEVPILLSPSTALKQSNNQDFVFGTSSQLVLDDSPRALRELQLAIQASNKPDEDNEVDDQAGLWHAGARDADGSLLEFRYIGSAPSAPAPPSPSPQPRNVTESASNQECLFKTASEMKRPVKKDTEEPKQDSVPADEATESGKVPMPKSRTPKKTKKPNYDLLTDVQLARKIKSFGFKPIKRRSAMIKVLDQCWESQHQDPSPPGLQAATTSVALQSPKAVTPSKVGRVTKTAKKDEAPKRPRGRPKKLVADATSTPEAEPKEKAKPRPKSPAKSSRAKNAGPPPSVLPIEIPDSDDILDEQLSAPSTPAQDSSSPGPVFASPSAAPLELSTGDEADMSLALSPTDNEEILFKYITEVVKSTPRSTNPAEPSWHEQMLLYDPIVLEDFTAWLNSGELTKVGYDAEVAPSVVKKWCESKSVVCLWKQTSRGKERKRY